MTRPTPLDKDTCRALAELSCLHDAIWTVHKKPPQLKWQRHWYKKMYYLLRRSFKLHSLPWPATFSPHQSDQAEYAVRSFSQTPRGVIRQAQRDAMIPPCPGQWPAVAKK
jgi:hypothetical protein